MAVCSRCSAALIATARFCAACGSPVGLATTPRPGTQPMSARPGVGQPTPSPSPAPAAAAAPSAPDPFARTMMGDPNAVPTTSEPRMQTAPLAQVAIAPARPNPVSPMASSVMNTPGDPNRKPASSVGATPWSIPASVANPYAPTRPPPPVAPVVPAPMASFGPGAMVLVHWSDGNRYPGTVLQAANGQLLVAFPNGAQQWVDTKYVSSGT